MKITTIKKWGNSYALRLPKDAVRRLNLEEGQPVEIREVGDGREISIIPTRHSNTSLKKIVSRITKENRHKLADWGNQIGNEIW